LPNEARRPEGGQLEERLHEFVPYLFRSRNAKRCFIHFFAGYRAPLARNNIPPRGVEQVADVKAKIACSQNGAAESGAQSDGQNEHRVNTAELETLIENWSLLTADDRRRIIAIVNGRLA